jgi:hypothetical protein
LPSALSCYLLFVRSLQLSLSTLLPFTHLNPHTQLTLKKLTCPQNVAPLKSHHGPPHEDVIEVGLERFVADLDGEDASALSDGIRNHGQKLIEAFEEGLDSSIPPSDRLRKLRLSGEARMLLNMDLLKEHKQISDWMMLPEEDKAQYDGIPAWADGTDYNPFPHTLLQVHLRYELKKYNRRGNMELVVKQVLPIVRAVEREGLAQVDRKETPRAFMLKTAIRDVLRLDLTVEHRQFAKLVQTQREYTQALKSKM